MKTHQLNRHEEQNLAILNNQILDTSFLRNFMHKLTTFFRVFCSDPFFPTSEQIIEYAILDVDSIFYDNGSEVLLLPVQYSPIRDIDGIPEYAVIKSIIGNTKVPEGLGGKMIKFLDPPYNSIRFIDTGCHMSLNLFPRIRKLCQMITNLLSQLDAKIKSTKGFIIYNKFSDIKSEDEKQIESFIYEDIPFYSVKTDAPDPLRYVSPSQNEAEIIKTYQFELESLQRELNHLVGIQDYATEKKAQLTKEEVELQADNSIIGAAEILNFVNKQLYFASILYQTEEFYCVSI